MRRISWTIAWAAALVACGEPPAAGTSGTAGAPASPSALPSAATPPSGPVPGTPGPTPSGSAPEPPPVAPPAEARPTPATEPCADCHPDHVAQFARTGMGRSLRPVRADPPVETLPSPDVHHPPSGLVYRAYVDAEGRHWQEERLPGTPYVRRVEALYAVGSGNHTRSYFGRVDGGLVELPLTWYARRRLWDMSPGYQGPANPRFSRVIEPPCLFCHNDLTPLRADAVNEYVEPLAEGISCRRCHGDGAAHVAARAAGLGPAAGAADATIYNPGRDTPARQLQVCQQCHLQGEAQVLHDGRRWDAYEPNEPLDRYVSTYVRTGRDGDAFGIASHAERLGLSRCAQASGPRMRCTTCHDPHRPASDLTYAQACLSCHRADACHDPAGTQAGAECAGCHMRSGGTADIPHVVLTDHFIRKRPTADQVKTEPGTSLSDRVANAEPATVPAAQVRLGLAHAQLWERLGLKAHLPLAVATLTAALAAVPDRAEAWATLGRARAASGDPFGALAAFGEAEARRHDDPLFPEERARVLTALRHHDDAARLLRAALAARPTGSRWLALARVEAQRGDLPAATAALDAAEKSSEGLAADVAEERAQHAMRGARPDEAAKWLETALARDPLRATTALWLAALHADAGRFDRARALADGLVKRDPSIAPAWFLRGRLALEANDLPAALNDLERAVKLDPRQPAMAAELAGALQRAGRVGEAREVVRQALARVPGDPGLQQLAAGLGAAP